MDDDEVPAAEPATGMGDRRQRALRDRVVRHFDALGPEAQVFGDPREGEKIRTVALARYLAGEMVIVELATVTGRNGRERCRAAVGAPPLAHEREFPRRAATEPAAGIHCDDLEARTCL